MFSWQSKKNCPSAQTLNLIHYTLDPVVMNCPVCGSLNFFVKDPDDEFETYEFELKGRDVVFNPEAAESGNPDLKADTEVFCEKCAWHDKFQELKKR